MLKELLAALQDSDGIEPSEELIDTLIAVSVVAKRLAEKLRREMQGEG